MRDYIGIILVAILVLRTGYCGYCGTLTFDKDSYMVGGNALLTYRPYNPNAKRQWFRKSPTLKKLNITNASKYEELNNGNSFVLRINMIDTADAGEYRAFCSQAYTDPVYLKVKEYSKDSVNCGRIEFKEPSVYRGESAILIYTPVHATSSVRWFKFGSIQSLQLYPNENLRSSTKYKEVNTEDGLNLIISETDLADIGYYEILCGGSSWSPRVKLDVIEPIPPTNPTFEDVEDIYDCKKCLPARLNVPVNVTCSVYGGSKPVELKMYKSEELLSVVWTELKNKTSITVNSFTPTIHNIDTVFKCTVKNPALKAETSVTTKLFMKVEPKSVEIKAQTMEENETSNVQCTTINGSPPTEALFYLNDKLQNTVNITKTIQSGYTYNVTTTLRTKLTRRDNHASVRCCIDSSRRVCSNTEYLNISFPPKSVFLTKITNVSAENGDTVLVLKCDVDESNPKSVVDWQGVKNIPKQLLEEKYINHTAPHGWTYTTSWMFNLTKEDRHREITCQVKNSEFSDLRLQQSYKPYITYSPLITIAENGIKNVYIGDNVILSCYVNSNPSSIITWYNKTEKINETNRRNRLDLHLVNVTIEHSQTYTCKARNGIGGTKSRDVTLTVNVRLIPSEKAYIQPSSEASRFSLLVPVTGGAAAIIIAIVIVVGFLTLRKKRNNAQPKRKGTQQIEDEPRHESVDPARNEPLHNEIPASNEKEIDNAPQYACVIPKANRKHGTNELKPEDTPEYSGVIPKSKRKSETDLLKSADGTEYACVIPKAQRKQEMDQRKSDGASAKTQGDTLVYAELDLNLDSGATTRRPLTKQYEPTEYVTIDFSKTGTIKIEKEEIEEEPKIEHDEMAEEGVKKENKDM